MSPQNPILLEDCIPKKDTQQEDFLLKYPEYDGRGILIAIIDTGFDLSMPGLQKTTTGLPKILDCFNFNVVGKVDTSAVRESEDDNILIGSSGRKLKIPLTWKNPSGQWHLGSKAYNELFWIYKISDENKENNVEKLEEKRDNDLKKPEISQNDIFDCIVWFDGKKWRACISASENLENAKVLTNYFDEHEFGFINDNSYCVKIKEEGNLLEIFCPNCPFKDHGTIVANTAAGYFPNKPHLNGLAPGAQIILMNVTFCVFSIEKALCKCIEMKVDIINLSIGFTVITPNITKIIKDVTEKHGIIIFKAPPNKGPLYSSLKEDPSCIFDQVFNIGSTMSHEIQCKFDEKCEEGPLTLASASPKGPLNSGERGIDFTAPGAIISNYPYRLKTKDGLYHGTSFATPNAAGSIACLLSALKANSINYSPTLLKLALSNTAYLPEGGDKLGFGDGIIQINSAFEYFKNLSKSISANFQIPKLTLFTCKKNSVIQLSQKGIYLIQKDCDRFCKKYCIKINENKNDEISWITKVTNGGEKFVEFSTTVTNGMFYVNINTESLNPGSLNFAEIHGINSSNIPLGPIFKFPITVIISKLVTKKENNIFQKEIILSPKIPYSLFVHSAYENSKCTVKLSASEGIREEIFWKYSIENCAIRNEQKQKFTKEKNCKMFSIPLILQNQMLQIFIYRNTPFGKNLEIINLNLEIVFQENSKPKIQSKNKKKRK